MDKENFPSEKSKLIELIDEENFDFTLKVPFGEDKFIVGFLGKNSKDNNNFSLLSFFNAFQNTKENVFKGINEYLNLNDENKTCMLKLEKTYKDDFEKRYVFVKDKININKTNRRITYLMAQKDKYKSLISKLDDFGFNIDKIVFSPLALAQFIGKKHIISGEKTGLFINIDKNNTILVVTKGPHLIDYKITNLGLYPIYDCIAKFQERNTDDVVSDPFGEKSIEVEIMVKEYFQSIITDVKKISYLKDFTINDFYFHSEYGLEEFIKKQFEKHLNLKFKTIVKLDDSIKSCFQAVSVLRCTTLTLPVRVK